MVSLRAGRRRVVTQVLSEARAVGDSWGVPERAVFAVGWLGRMERL